MKNNKLKERLNESFNKYNTNKISEFKEINKNIDYESIIGASEKSFGPRFNFKPLLTTVLIICFLVIPFAIERYYFYKNKNADSNLPSNTPDNGDSTDPGESGSSIIIEELDFNLIYKEFVTLDEQLSVENFNSGDSFYNIEITDKNNRYKCLYLNNQIYNTYFKYLNLIEDLSYQKHEFYKLDFYNYLVNKEIISPSEEDLLYVDYNSNTDILPNVQNYSLIMVNLIKDARILNDLSTDLNVDTTISFDYNFKIENNQVLIESSILQRIPKQILIKGKSITNEDFIKTNSLNDLIVKLDNSFYYIIEQISNSIGADSMDDVSKDNIFCIGNTEYDLYLNLNYETAKPSTSGVISNGVCIYQYNVIINTLKEKIEKLN